MGFGDGRKTGRGRIIKWLCERHSIVPFTVPLATTSTADDSNAQNSTHHNRHTGATSHSEAVLATSDPAQKRLIDEATRNYARWSSDDLLFLAKQRSYLLLKDSDGKLPSKSKASMTRWLAAWDVLKSPREKARWEGDGIDLVNKAKAMGFTGSSTSKFGVTKYEVILWLCKTPEDADTEVTVVAAPTPVKAPKRQNREDSEGDLASLAKRVSRRPAKGSTRSGVGANGWGIN